MKKFWNMLKNSFVGNFVRIIWISAKRYKAGECRQRAVALTYYTLFAIVPTAALLFGIAKGFGLDNKLRADLTERLAQHKDLLEYICTFADTTLKQAKGGVVAGVGVIALFITVIGLSSNIERAFNAVWELPPRRNLLHRFSSYVTCMVVIPVLIVVMSSVGVLLQTMVANNSVASFIFARIIPLLVSSLVFFLIYLLTPNTRVRVFPALLAGIVAGISYQLLQDIFVLLQGSIFRYNRIYGSFAALPLFMVWLSWSWEIALFGAEIGFVAQHIGTGKFDANANPPNASIRSQRLRQLAVARNIYAKFFSGKGETTFRELKSKLKMPIVCLEHDLEKLVAAGVICRTQNAEKDNAYVPLRPADLTVAECVRMLNVSGDDATNPELVDLEAKLIAVETRMWDALRNAPDNTPLTEVGEKAAEETPAV